MRKPELRLSKALSERLDNAVIEIVQDVVASCRDRDQQLAELRAQNEGDSMQGAEGPWENSCKLEDSVSREMHTTLLAALRQARRYPYYLVEPTQPGDDIIAAKLEDWLNTTLRSTNFEEALDHAAYLCLESRWAPMRVSWHVYAEKRVMQGRPPTDPTDELLEPEREMYYDIPRTQIGLRFQVLEPWNVYTYPTNAASFAMEDANGAVAIIERIWMTKHDLITAITASNYDEDAVMEVVSDEGHLHGALEEEHLERLGIEGTDMIACYVYLGRPPILLDYDGKLEIPRELLEYDILWVVVPARQKVLLRQPSPYPVRPYCHFTAFDVPNSLLGHGIVSLLTEIQNEMTATLRLAMDNMSLVASAPFIVPEAFYHRYGAVKFGPGRTIPAPNNGLMQQLPVDTRGAQIALEFQHYLYQRASQIAAAQSINSMLGGKVRKAAEVEFTANVIQTKFDLVAANYQRGMQRAAEVILAFLAEHIDPDGNPTLEPIPGMTIFADEAIRRFRWVPQVSSDNVNPAARLQRDVTMMQVVRQSPLWQLRIAQGDMSGEYALLRTFLEHMGVTDPQQIIGPEPPGPAAQPMGLPMAPTGEPQPTMPAAGHITPIQPLGEEEE